MSIFYLDPVNGNDSNTGADWANAWKTIKNGATAARIAPGDVIRVAKSPDPVNLGSATWTNLSKTITLASSQTLNVDTCESAWTASENVTCAANASLPKQGDYREYITIAAGFVTGKIAYKAIGSAVDFSSFTKLSFWVSHQYAVTANTFKLCLCSDASGDTIVDEFIIPAQPSGTTGAFYPATVDKGSALGSSIQSVALYAISDPGACIITLDNILACNGFSLTSLISKNSLANGGTEPWYGIKSIDGTTVVIDNDTNCASTSGRGYGGSSETVTTYYRNCFQVSAQDDCTVQDSGAAGSLIEFQGGYNPSNNAQDGETFFDGMCGQGYGLYTATKSYLKFRRFSFCRFLNGAYFYAGTGLDYSGQNISNNSQGGVEIGSPEMIVNINAVVNQHTSYTGINLNSLSVRAKVTVGICEGQTISIDTYSGFCTINFTRIGNNGSAGYGLYMRNQYGFKIFGGIIKNVFYGITLGGNMIGRNFFYNVMIDPAVSTPITHSCPYTQIFRNCNVSSIPYPGAPYDGAALIFEKHGGDINDNRKYVYYGRIESQTAVRHTASGVAWKISPISDYYINQYTPLTMRVCCVAVAANALVTISAWFRRTHAGITGKLSCAGMQIDGVDSDVEALMTAAADTWEQLSISFTPTAAGVVEILAVVYGGSTYSVYVDDIEITQA